MSEAKEFKSRQSSVVGFQLKFDTHAKMHQWLRDKPEWFTDAYYKGKIYIVNNPKQKIVSIDHRGGFIRVEEGSWICLNKAGVIFAITDAEFQEAYDAGEMDITN